MGTPSSDLLSAWLMGFQSLFAFAMQMILMLALGHALAVSPLIKQGLKHLALWVVRRRFPAFWVTLLTGLICWLQWGVGLIAGGILARSVAENMAQDTRKHLIQLTAAAYGGFIVWHGGWSGSAPLLVATPNNFLIEKGILTAPISVGETLLSPLNLLLLAGVLLSAAVLVSVLKARPVLEDTPVLSPSSGPHGNGWDYTAVVGGVILALGVTAFVLGLQKMDLNMIILLLFAGGLMLHHHSDSFSSAVKEGLQGTVGILLQFPLYGAIMGVMKSSGLATSLSEQMMWASSESVFLVMTFLSAGFLNLVVPSGGGQWAIQATILMPLAQKLNLALPPVVVAFSWGDAWTNLIQPFWALPLLAMTGVQAREVLPLTAKLCLGTGLVISLILALSPLLGL